MSIFSILHLFIKSWVKKPPPESPKYISTNDGMFSSKTQLLKSFSIIKASLLPLKAFVEIRNNNYPTLILNDYKGNTGEYKLEEYTTTALNKPTTRESIIDQIQKMGDTPFFVDSIEVSVDENIFIPIKTLNLLTPIKHQVKMLFALGKEATAVAI